MKAIYFTEHGSVDVLQYGDIDKPVPAENEALLSVQYASLNHLDIWVRRGWKGLKLSMPHVTGSDILGTVEAINGSSSKFKAGDTVMVNPGYNLVQDEWTANGENSVSPGFRVLGEHRPGGLAQYVCAPIECLYGPVTADKPESLAAMPVAAQTCWRMLKTLAAVTSKQTVLIVGSGGGVNSLCIQLCKSFGCETFVLCGSDEKAANASDLGATVTINYVKNPHWHREILGATNGRGVDIAIDNVGAKTFNKSLKSLRFGGKLFTVGNTSGPEILLDNRMIFGKQLAIIGSTMGSHDDFASAVEYMTSNNITPVIDCVRPLAAGIEEIKRIEAGKQFGKIVLNCKEV